MRQRRETKIIQMGSQVPPCFRGSAAAMLGEALRAQCAEVIAGRAVGRLALVETAGCEGGCSPGGNAHAPWEERGREGDAHAEQDGYGYGGGAFGVYPRGGAVSMAELSRAAQACRGTFLREGVLVEPLAIHGCGILLYACRPELLMDALADTRVRRILRGLGYDTRSTATCLAGLKRRASCAGGDFPCEVGFFLGLPVEDPRLLAFAHRSNSLCSGPWRQLVAAAEPRDPQQELARGILGQAGTSFAPAPHCPVLLSMN